MSVALGWSGGKDSARVLQELRSAGVEPEALLTTVTEGYERVSMHGVRRNLLRQQARAVGVPLLEVTIPPGCSNALYEERMAAALASEALAGVDEVAFGDLFLEAVRAYREKLLDDAGLRASFPVWGRDTGELAREFVCAGFQAFVVCLDPTRLDPSFAGRRYDEAFLTDLPAEVDPCGENGEFHTFVADGPIFREPVPCLIGTTVEREGFVFCDLYSAGCASKGPAPSS